MAGELSRREFLKLGALAFAAGVTGCLHSDEPPGPTPTTIPQTSELPLPEIPEPPLPEIPIQTAVKNGLSNWKNLQTPENAQEPMVKWIFNNDSELNQYPDIQFTLIRKTIPPSEYTRVSMAICQRHSKYKEIPFLWAEVHNWDSPDNKPELDTLVMLLLMEPDFQADQDVDQFSLLTHMLLITKEGYHIRQYAEASENWHRNPQGELVDTVCPQMTDEQVLRAESLGFLQLGEVVRQNRATIAKQLASSNNPYEEVLLDRFLKVGDFIDNYETTHGVEIKAFSGNQAAMDSFQNMLIDLGILR